MTIRGREGLTHGPQRSVGEDELPCRGDACTATFVTSCLEATAAAAPLSAVCEVALSFPVVPFTKGPSRRPLTVGVGCDSARPTVRGSLG